MTNQELMERLDAALKAITVTGLGDSRLEPEQAERFVRVVEERTVLLGQARRLTMRNDRRNIDRTEFSGRILEAPQDEGDEFTGEATPSFTTNQLVAEKVRGRAILSDEALEENIERDDFENTLIDMIAAGAGVDLEELLIAGDEGSGDTFLALTDGWLVKAGNSVTGSGTAPDFAEDDIEDMFESMLLAVPEKYLQDRSRWRFYVTFAQENDYRNVLRARGTALGDTAQTGNQPLFYKGIRLEVVPKMPAGEALLTSIDNAVYGIRREIEIEPERKASHDRWDFHVRAKADAHYEDENGAVAADGYTG